MSEQRRESNINIAPNTMFVQTGGVENFAKIKVVGVGGAGCNAVNRMIDAGVQGVEFITVNTDHQVIALSKAPVSLQIGEKVTRGLGAGAEPGIGAMAANESRDELSRLIQGADLLFLTAGMGGGTGTGAAPVIAALAREMGILTVAVVTKPFYFEGSARERNANVGIKELEEKVDALIMVPNDKLLEIADDDMEVKEAFAFADQILKFGVSGISDLITNAGSINLDLADVRRILVQAGICHMGIGRAAGENRASVAVDEAIHSPLLETSIDGAHRVIINFTGNLKMKEVKIASSLVRDAVAPDADIIIGMVDREDMGDEVSITVIASGFDRPNDRGGKPLVDTKTAVNSTNETKPLSFFQQLNQESAKPTKMYDNSFNYAPTTNNGGSVNAESINNYTPNPALQPTPTGGTGNYRSLERPQHEPKRTEQAPKNNRNFTPSEQRKAGIIPWFFSESEYNED